VTGRLGLSAAVRRTATAAVVLALLVLPILSRGGPAHARDAFAGILCAQPDGTADWPAPALHEDCALSCALAQVQILPPLADPAFGRMSSPMARTASSQRHLPGGGLVGDRHIRGPPEGCLA
jgi:hypothetical protein